jgi:ADP-ribosylglycohydrolase
MVSDDTEHTVFVAQCLAEGLDAQSFQRKLAWKLRWWLLCVPAGIGFATLRAILRLWVGIPPSHSGVFSAGNGPAMRSALIGTYFAGTQNRIRDYVRTSTRLTHTDPKAETAAFAVAMTAAWSVSGLRPEGYLQEIHDLWISASPEDTDWIGLIQKIGNSYDRQLTVAEFAQELGLKKGVTGYAFHTVPVALYAWLKHYGDYRAGLEAVFNCGGDTDTVGAITGALLAINSTIPGEWVTRLCDYPISRSYLERLAHALEVHSEGIRAKLPTFAWMALPFRNLFFLIVVLTHVCLRVIF